MYGKGGIRDCCGRGPVTAPPDQNVLPVPGRLARVVTDEGAHAVEVEAHDGAVAGDGYAMIGARVAAECVGDEEFGWGPDRPQVPAVRGGIEAGGWPASIECPVGTDTDSCLTPQEVTVVRNEYLGPHDSQGNEFFGGGLPYGSEPAWDLWVTSVGGPAKGLEDYQFAQNYLTDMAFVHSPASFSLSSWKFDIASYQSMEELAGIYDATSPDLSAFKRADGKLIIYSGWADQAIPPFSQVDYYAAVEKETGGFTASQSFTRLYMVPGGYHCLKGGDPSVTADFLTPLINWVEDGQAPSSLTLAVTGQSTGYKITSLTVAPFNALAPAPKNNGLNSNYKIYGQAALYAKSHEKV